MFCELDHFHRKVLSTGSLLRKQVTGFRASLSVCPQGLTKQNIEPKLHVGAEPLLCLHHDLCWEQICLLFNPWLMRGNAPHFAHWSVILLIWFRNFLYFFEYIWGGQLEVGKGRQMFSLPLQTRCCLTGSQRWINCLAHLCQQPNVH